MFKKYRLIIIITSLIILLPIAAGCILWDRLPSEMATHFDGNGNANGYSGKAFAVLGLPIFLFVIHLICFFVTALDPKRNNIHYKALGIVLWICPAVSVICGVAVYSYSLGYNIPLVPIIIAFTGVLLAVIGNYLPKCKQNYTMGIKLPWTLADETVWNKTHRLAGFLWMIGGIIIAATAFLKSFAIFITVTAVIVIAPAIYSYVIYRKKGL